MFKRKFTTVTQIHESNNKELLEYVESTRSIYNTALRETFHVLKHSKSFNKSSYNTFLQGKYNITKRTANSILSEAQGRLNALKELKKYEKKQLEAKIEYLETTVIPELTSKLDDNKRLIRVSQNINFQKHRNLKRKVVAKKAKLNHLKQKLDNLKFQIETGLYKLCFGSKKLLQKDYKTFVEVRDRGVSFVGAKSEPSCNQQLQLSYNPKNNQFDLKLRKDFGFKQVKGDDRFVFGKVYFRNHKDKLISALKDKTGPLSYKIIKRNNRYYLHCTFEIKIAKNNFLTRSDYGTIGLDFNKGFITLSETDRYGNLLRTDYYPYRFRQGSKTKTDLEKIVSEIIKISLDTGKDLCIENLDFKDKKSKTETKQGRKYNKMLHSLAYRSFTKLVENIAFRNRVYTRKVNPAWTSWLAKHKYCPTMKLNVHVGVSFVIARRGQGFKESF